MYFTTKNKHIQQTALPHLEIKEVTKHLGVTIDSKLTWQPHVDQLCKKLSSGTYVIRRIKQVGGLDTAKVAYYALFESHLRYGIAIWGATANTNLERALIQQKRAIRCLAGLHYQESCRDAFKQLKILTVVTLYIRETILYAVTTKQPRHQDIHQYNTRHASDFTLPPHHLSLYAKKPTYKGSLYYNHLPDLLKNLSPQQFKNKLTTWLQERPYYTETEFLNNCIV